MIETIILLLILITLGSVLKKSEIICIIALLLTLLIPEYRTYTILIIAIGILNIFSMFLMKNQIKGVDYSLIALITLATIYVVYTNDLAMLLLIFILASIPTYILVMLNENRVNIDVAIKYITFMVFATVLFTAGAVIMSYANIIDSNFLYALGFIMLITGLCIEVGCAPMHEWVPDVYYTAHPIPTSIIASIVKIVPFIVTYKILILLSNPIITKLVLFVAIISAISMFVGNIGALTSVSPARILAYSSIANMGYILSTIVALTDTNWIPLALAGALLQLLANSLGKIGFFISLKNGASNYLLYPLAFSFIGMPPLIGFWGKLFIVLSLINVNYMWLALILVINSAISIPYYIRIARLVSKPVSPNYINAIVSITVALTFITIVPPNWFIDLVREIIGGCFS